VTYEELKQGVLEARDKLVKASGLSETELAVGLGINPWGMVADEKRWCNGSQQVDMRNWQNMPLHLVLEDPDRIVVASEKDVRQIAEGVLYAEGTRPSRAPTPKWKPEGVTNEVDGQQSRSR